MESPLRSMVTKEYNAIDLLKFILSVFVMVIHSGMDKTVISPVLRTAVPLFFIVSAFFFFSKKSSLLRFIKRNVYLYLIWSVVQIPIVLYTRDYLSGSAITGIKNIAMDIVLGNGFTGSWYIMAMVIGMPIVAFLSKKISTIWLVIVTAPIYVVCCFATNYWNLLPENSWLVILIEGYQNTTGLYIFTSFPIALFWISVGKLLAEKPFVIGNWLLWLLGAVSAGLLAMERVFIVGYGWEITDDCYFMLAFLCPVIFLLFKRWNIVFTTRFRLREYSTLIYVVHGSCERLVGYGLKLLPFSFLQGNLIKVLLSLAMILMLGIPFFYIKNKKKIKLLNYAC